MVNWRNIHLDFTRGLRREWEARGFNYDSCKEWIDISSLDPNDADFAQWLRDELEVEPEQVLSHKNKEILWEQYENHLEKEKGLINGGTKESNSKYINEEEWQNIHPCFNLELQKQWEEKGFSCKQTKEWINIGLRVKDANFANYLKAQGFTSKEFSSELYNSHARKLDLLVWREAHVENIATESDEKIKDEENKLQEKSNLISQEFYLNEQETQRLTNQVTNLQNKSYISEEESQKLSESIKELQKKIKNVEEQRKLFKCELSKKGNEWKKLNELVTRERKVN